MTDWNNALKLGFDCESLCFPPAFAEQPWASALPSRVLEPGVPMAPLTAEVIERAGLHQACEVAAGTTDSIAAFLAAGAARVGDAVTSLGSTLAIKLLSERPVQDKDAGVYSHRLGAWPRLARCCSDHPAVLHPTCVQRVSAQRNVLASEFFAVRGAGVGWLVGGASNSGGAVLRQHFSDTELEALTPRMDPSAPTGLAYYPLPAKGERFPVNDPDKEPCIVPRPDDDAVFLQGASTGPCAARHHTAAVPCSA